MKINEVRKYILDNFKCVKDVRINDLFDMETWKRSGTRATVYLDNKTLYAVGWVKELQTKIEADNCYITNERNRLTILFDFRYPKETNININ